MCTRPPAPVLVVDDDPVFRPALARELGPVAGAGGVVEVGCGAAALEYLDGGRAALVVLDLGLPGDLDGFAVLRRIRETPDLRRTPVVVVSIREEGEALARALRGGADDYFCKSNDWGTFRARVERLTGRHDDHEQERAALRDELRQTRLMADGIKHDIAPCLLALRTRLDALPPGEARDGAVECLAHLSGLVDELDWLRPEPAAAPGEPTDLGAVAGRVAAEFAGRHPGVAVRVVQEVGRPTTRAISAARLARVADNLVRNAVEAVRATGESGTVTVRVLARGRDAVLEVMDTGPGIEADALPRVFEPYYSSRAGEARRQRGLGLFVVKSLVTGAGGRVTVSSVPGRWTAFTVALPAD